MKDIKPMWHEPPISHKAIKNFIDSFKYHLPESFVSVVSKYDSLTPVKNIFDFINVYGQSDERDVNFLSLKEEESENIYESQYVSNPLHYGTPHLVAFGICANGDNICFDYRDNPKGNSPKVVLVYHDDYQEEDDGSSYATINHVADSFEEFMEMLHE